MHNREESKKILKDEIRQRGGLSMDEVIGVEKERKLWFGGTGIIRMLLKLMRLGQVEYDDTEEKFKIPPSR